MSRPTPFALDVIGTLVRLGLAAVWLVSGAIKALDPAQTYVAVQAYDVLPTDVVGAVATAVPLVELGLGLVLLAGLFTRAAAIAAAVVLVLFIAAIAQAWARGLSIDCGCFGAGGPVDQVATAYPREILIDTGFLLLAGWLVVRPRTLAALGEPRRRQPAASGQDR